MQVAKKEMLDEYDNLVATANVAASFGYEVETKARHTIGGCIESLHESNDVIFGMTNEFTIPHDNSNLYRRTERLAMVTRKLTAGIRTFRDEIDIRASAQNHPKEVPLRTIPASMVVAETQRLRTKSPIDIPKVSYKSEIFETVRAAVGTTNAMDSATDFHQSQMWKLRYNIKGRILPLMSLVLGAHNRAQRENIAKSCDLLHTGDELASTSSQMVRNRTTKANLADKRGRNNPFIA